MEDRPSWFEELASFLRIRSISAEDDRVADVWEAAEWVSDFIRGCGGKGEVIRFSGSPIVDATIRSTVSGEVPTVICYGHVDVQPVDPIELWDTDPFDPEIRDGLLFGRGTADDKGQLYMLLSAARELHARGKLPVNVRFIGDGEEESGGTSVVDWLRAFDVAADAAVIFDTSMTSESVPIFNIGTRGQVALHVTVTTGAADVHSGAFGGAALNAGEELIKAFSALVPVDGLVPAPLREGATAPTRTELQSWATLRPGDQELALQGVRARDETAAEEFYLRTLAQPSADINGVYAGSPLNHKTIIPSTAYGNVSIRLVPGQDPKVIAERACTLLRDSVSHGTEITIETRSCSPASLISTDSRAIVLAQDAFERTLARRPLLIRHGGTIPIVPAFTAAMTPVILTGFARPDSRIHGPNENLRVNDVELGTAAARELFQAFGAL